MSRDRDLFSDERIKNEFMRVIQLCRDTDECGAYLKRIHYFGCVGDRGTALQNNKAVRDYVDTVRDPDLIDYMYSAALEYFAKHYKQPRSSQNRYSELSCGGGGGVRPIAEHHQLRDSRMLEIGRSGSCNDWHHVMRGELYGFTRDQLKRWPLAGVYVRKSCHQCGSVNSPTLIECAHCHDAFYCTSLCQEMAAAKHENYCRRSSSSQQWNAFSKK